MTVTDQWRQFEFAWGSGGLHWRPPETLRERIQDTWRFWDQYYVPARCAYCRLPGHVMADDRLHEWCWLELK